MTKEEFIKEFSKIEDTFEDEFRGKYNSPELIWEALGEQLKLTSVNNRRKMLIAFLEMLENTPQVKIPLNVGMVAVDIFENSQN